MTEFFQMIEEKSNNPVPCHKKDIKNLMQNYRSISVLAFFSKVFERWTACTTILHKKKLFTDCQSGFMSGDSCVSQLLSNTHEIYKSFDCNPPADIRGVFLDILKAFAKVWHDCLIFKLQSYDIDGKLLRLLKGYLKDR